MRAVVDAAQALAVDVAVHLGRRQRAVAKKLLDRAKVGPSFEQMRCERVAKTMRVREHAPHRRGVEPPAARRDEQRVLRAARELRPGFVEVVRKAMRRLLAEW